MLRPALMVQLSNGADCSPSRPRIELWETAFTIRTRGQYCEKCWPTLPMVLGTLCFPHYTHVIRNVLI